MDKTYVVTLQCKCKYEQCQLRKMVTDTEYSRLRGMGKSIDLILFKEAQFKCPLEAAKYDSTAIVVAQEMKKEEPEKEAVESVEEEVQEVEDNM